MAIPDYQQLMLPLLQLAADEQEHRLSDMIDTLADALKLTEAERAEILPSGQQPSSTIAFLGRPST
jgi:restriction system protein